MMASGEHCKQFSKGVRFVENSAAAWPARPSQVGHTASDLVGRIRPGLTHGWVVNSQVALLTKEISIASEPAFGRGEP